LSSSMYEQIFDRTVSVKQRDREVSSFQLTYWINWHRNRHAPVRVLIREF
ncbi:hypothetical protein BAE44_0006959, partial [Dichanthelium oligosanthes]